MIWYQILENLKTHLSKLEDFYGVNIQIGSGVQLNKYPSIQLLRDSEEITGNGRDGEITFWIYPIIKSDSKNPDDGSKKLYELEKQILDEIPNWVKSLKNMGIVAMFETGKVEGDGDNFRPLMSSIIPIKLKYKK